jgi:signal recognition particle GTPase
VKKIAHMPGLRGHGLTHTSVMLAKTMVARGEKVMVVSPSRESLESIKQRFTPEEQEKIIFRTPATVST